MPRRGSSARHAGKVFPLYDDPEWVAPLSVGTVHGGEWHSTVAETVVAEGRFGVFPGESVTEARRGFEQAVADAAGRDPWLAAHPPRIDWFEGQFESGATPADHPLIVTLGAAHQRVLNRRPRLRGVPYGSDLRLFTNHAGMAAVLYGPGEVALAHAVNESIEVTEILEAVAVLAMVIMTVRGADRDSATPLTATDGIPDIDAPLSLGAAASCPQALAPTTTPMTAVRLPVRRRAGGGLTSRQVHRPLYRHSVPELAGGSPHRRPQDTA
jgi:hypothetical protein